MTLRSRCGTTPGLIHDAFIYSSEEDFATFAVPFLREAVVAGQPTIAVTTADRIRLLQGELGAGAAEVAFFESDTWYARPGAALAAWRAAVDERRGSGPGPIRAIGEVYLGVDRATDAQWARYESLFNRAFADLPVWVVCPYDARSVSDAVLADVRRTHPVVSTVAAREPSPEHFSSHELGAAVTPLDGELDPRGVQGTATVVRNERELPSIRRRVTWPASAAGLPRATIEDLVFAVTELAGSALGLPGGSATVRTAAGGGEWICEVGIGGGALLAQSDLPVVIGRILCDRLEIGHGPDASVVRFVFGARRPPRQRILAAASELFAQKGLRASGVNTIISRAGVAKATFYACFSSKDELIHEWIRSPEARQFRDVWFEVEARTQSPAEQLTEFFDVLGEWLTASDFRCWPFLTSIAELAAVDQPARDELARLMTEAEDHFRRAASAAGLPDPDELAAQLNLLRTGALAAAVIDRSRRPVDLARAAAVRLVSAATSRAALPPEDRA